MWAVAFVLFAAAGATPENGSLKGWLTPEQAEKLTMKLVERKRRRPIHPRSCCRHRSATLSQPLRKDRFAPRPSSHDRDAPTPVGRRLLGHRSLARTREPRDHAYLRRGGPRHQGSRAQQTGTAHYRRPTLQAQRHPAHLPRGPLIMWSRTAAWPRPPPSSLSMSSSRSST